MDAKVRRVADEHLKEIRKLMANIEEGLGRYDADDINWGHAGDLIHLENLLDEAWQFIAEEGTP